MTRPVSSQKARQWHKNRWLWVIGISVVTLFGLLGSVSAYSVLAWRSVDETSVQVFDDQKQLLETTLSQREGEGDAAYFNRLKEVERQFAAIDCAAPHLLGWQSSIQSVEHILEHCHHREQLHRRAQEQFRGVVGYIDDHHAVTTILISDNSDKQVDEKAYQKHYDMWRKRVARAKIAETSEQYAARHTAIVHAGDAIVSAWKHVVEAHEAKDQKKFTAAQGELAKAYDKLSGQQDEAVRELTQLVQDFFATQQATS